MDGFSDGVYSFLAIAPLLAAAIKLFVEIGEARRIHEESPSPKWKITLARAKEIWDSKIVWLRDSEKKNFIVYYSRAKTGKIWSNAFSNIVLLLLIYAAIFVSEMCMRMFPQVAFFFRIFEFALAIFVLVAILMIVLDVPCIQGILFKARAFVYRLRNKESVTSVSLFEMRRRAENRPSRIIDARGVGDGDNNAIQGAIFIDDAFQDTLDKSVVYFCCSDYGVRSTEMAKKLTEAGFTAYSVRNACSHWKEMTRIAFELDALECEGLLNWQMSMQNEEKQNIR